MILSMSSDGMPLVMNAVQQGRIAVCHLPNDKEGRLDALRFQDVQHTTCVRRQGTVVERQHHFVIVQGQGLAVLHRPNPRVVRRAHGYGSAGSECVRIARTLAGEKRGAREPQQHDRSKYGPH